MAPTKKLIRNLMVATTPLLTIFLTGCITNASIQQTQQPQTQVQPTPSERNLALTEAPEEHTSVNGVREIIPALEPHRRNEQIEAAASSSRRPVLIQSDKKRTVTSPGPTVPTRQQQKTPPQQNPTQSPSTLCHHLTQSQKNYHAFPLPEEDKQALHIICSWRSRTREAPITWKEPHLYER